jgi:glycosyltransferase involved in cell wall biosynthesis
VARILMIAYTGYASDARVKRHARAIAERGDEIDVICLQNVQHGICDGVNVIGIQMPRYRGDSRLNYLASYVRFFAVATWTSFRRACSRRYDVAIVCSMPDAVVICTIPLRLFGTKVILDIHDTMPELYLDKLDGRHDAIGAGILRLEERISAGLADRVLAVHDVHRDRLEAGGIARRKISVVLNAPDRRIFAPEVGKPSDQPPHEFTLVCHGTITKRLGIDIALVALARLRERLPGLRLVVIGAGDYLPQVKSLAARLELGELVKFIAPVPVEQLPGLIRGASLGLIPNRQSPATDLMLPVKLLEYAALELPIVAARLRTVEYYFGDDAVRLFTPGDPDALADAITQLHDNPAMRRQLTSKAKRQLETIGWPEQRARYFQVIDSLMVPAAAAAESSSSGRRWFA